MRMVIEFSVDRVTRAPCAPIAFPCGVFGIRIATLDHESLNDAMKAGAIIESLFGQSYEILDGLWSGLWPELQNHIPLSCLNNGDLVRIRVGLTIGFCIFPLGD